MAEGGDALPFKKQKYDTSKFEIPRQLQNVLKVSFEELETQIYTGNCLVKIIFCDAQCNQTFSHCTVKTERNIDHEEYTTKEVFRFTSLFQRGTRLLTNYLNNTIDFSKTSRAEVLALQRLTSFLAKKADIEQKLMSFMKSKAKNETQLAVALVHHLLVELAVDQVYTVDDRGKYKQDFTMGIECFCCHEKDSKGQYGDCSIVPVLHQPPFVLPGHPEVWHGNLDIVIGNVAVRITDEDEEPRRLSAFEIKNRRSMNTGRHQIIAETIVFALLQKKLNPGFEHFLIPTIAVSCSDVLVFFYDPEHDILLESPPFPMFSNSVLHPPTILVLWFALNYRTFSSGITKGIKERHFTADFFSHTNENSRSIYKEKLYFGNVVDRQAEECFRPTKPGFKYNDKEESLDTDY